MARLFFFLRNATAAWWWMPVPEVPEVRKSVFFAKTISLSDIRRETRRSVLGLLHVVLYSTILLILDDYPKLRYSPIVSLNPNLQP